MGFSIIIPTRYDSQRLPGKALRELAGAPMIRHVYERACESGAERVAIATDDERIREAASGFGATVLMTSPAHQSGTDRLAEAVTQLACAPDAIIVNLQGDEPCMPPELLRQVAEALAAQPSAQVATLCAAITTPDEMFDPNTVKVVRDMQGFAQYFSRAPIPWQRGGFEAQPPRYDAAVPAWRHIGLYAYRACYLAEYAGLSPSPLERTEALEQLRVLWHGGRILVEEAQTLPAHGVDTEVDLRRAEAMLQAR